MEIIYIKDKMNINQQMDRINTRNQMKLDDVNQVVTDIIEDVKKNKDKALYMYAEKFDGVSMHSLRVTQEEIDEAYNACDKEFIDILCEARENIIEYHSKQKYAAIDINHDGRRLTQKITPIRRVGIYVPGGKSPYPSTVLMDSIPAFVAGVKEIAMITPADKSGNINKNILVAAKVCGITEIYKSGGAQAIAALAYGTETIEPVSMICGPGNLYVTVAKRMVYGDVDIDMLAGPSEILIVADKNANPVYAAADLLSQAEHDEAAGCILVTDDEALALEVNKEVDRQLANLSKKDIAQKAIDTYGAIFIVDGLETCFEIANEVAPEHLELLLDDADQYIDKIENAGSIFVGEYTPEPVGDYFAGTNHTIPTSGKAKFYSPLSSYDFMKRTSVISYSKEALKSIKDKVITFAEKEGLTAHANSVRTRFDNE